MDSSSVKYPNPSGVNVADFVTEKLTPSNYFIWTSMMFDLLKIYGLTGFVDGNIPSPPEKIGETENPDYLEWKKSDGLVRRWILSTINESVLIYVHQLPSAREMWIAIEKGSIQPSVDDIEIGQKGSDTSLSKYLPLSTSVLTGDLEKAKEFLDIEPDAVNAVITSFSETALMIAARSVDRVNIVRELLKMMDPRDLALCNSQGVTALHMAAGSGNIEAAKLLVEKNPSLTNVYDNTQCLPLHIAAFVGERKLVIYLLSVTKEDVEPKLFEGESGTKLVHGLVESELYDIALMLLKRHPLLAYQRPTALGALAMKQSAFKSGTPFNFYQRFIYSCVPMKSLENIETYSTSRVGMRNTTSSFISVKQTLHRLFWKIAKLTVPEIRSIQDTKTTNHHALELVKFLCSEIVKLHRSEASEIFGFPVKTASYFGVYEVIEEILVTFPSALYLADEMNRTLFHHAIINRRENIFNIIYQVENKHLFLRARDRDWNNCLHLAGFLENQQKLNLMEGAAGSALPMQHELQWFKAVKEFTLKQDKELRNKRGQTPAMVFTESHEDLVKEGVQWMKETSNSCTIAATLIVTIVFAAAITVPGGNNGTDGYPFFKTYLGFKVFVISDALALFASTSSVLTFLSIYTSRYGQQDFLYSIPKRLIIGLATLFLAIIFMMIAFAATLQIMFGQGRPWMLIPVVAFSCVPIMLFTFLQFPLLWNMIKSTYGPGIFRKQSNRMLF